MSTIEREALDNLEESIRQLDEGGITADAVVEDVRAALRETGRTA